MKCIIITGHYGCGKTNLALNMAFWEAENGASAALADLDIVNPYFRSADFAGELSARGIKLAASGYNRIGSTLDIPALNFGLNAANNPDTLIIDVGGDDEGAKVLGRYREFFAGKKLEFIYVINQRRYLDNPAEEAFQTLREIETASGMKAAAVVNNTHLGAETTREIIEASLPFAREFASAACLPLKFTCAPRGLYDKLPAGMREIDILVKPIWK